MQTLINIIVTLGLLFWASGVMFSPMMLGAPGAANRLGTWWFYIILFLTPVVIFALYWIFGGQFWGITGDALTKGFLILFVAAMLFFNVPLSMWNIYKGISNDGYSVKSQGVYYKGALIDGADGNSFTEFSEEQQGFYADNYARDAKYLYYNNKRVADADPDT
ncbi:MAG TPA: DKNYY domain-containing protein, partial [Marinagarivorans sp.]